MNVKACEWLAIPFEGRLSILILRRSMQAVIRREQQKEIGEREEKK